MIAYFIFWLAVLLSWCWLGGKFIEVGNVTTGHLSVGVVVGAMWALVLRVVADKMLDAYFAWKWKRNG